MPRALCISAAALLCLLGPMGAPGAAAAASEPADRRLEEVVVTASRRAELRLDVPASISRLSASELAAIGATHVAEALNRVPGVLIQRGSGQESLVAIRSPVLTGAGACGAFLVLDDGLPLRPPGFCNVNELFELNTGQAAAIEVLRGPGTALYGANAVHGIVNVISPTARELEGLRLGAEAGSGSFRRLSVAAGGTAGVPAPDRAAYDVAGWITLTRDAGFRADSGHEEAKVNLALDRELGRGRLRLRASGSYLDQETAGFIRGLDAYRDATLRRSNANPEAFREAWSARLAARWSAQPPQQCTACRDELQAMLRASGMRFLQHFLLGKPLEINGQQSLALAALRERELGTSGRASWLIGLDADLAQSTLEETQDGPTLEGTPAARAIRPAGRHYDYSVDASTAAAHAALRWKALEPLSLQLAARLEHSAFRYDNRMLDGNTAENGQPCGAGGCLYSRPADRSDRFTNFAPRLDLTWTLGANDRLYAAAARGFRPPEHTELYRLQRQQRQADLGSERIDAYELGWRHEAARASLSLAAFALEKRNSILRDANGFNVTGGRTRHRGVEYELEARLAEPLRVRLTGTIARHSYEFSSAIEGGETIRAGTAVDTAPRHLHRALLDWRLASAVDASLELEHTGRHVVDASNEHDYPGHTLLHARLGWRVADDWSLALRARNLTDRRYADRADFAQGEYRYFPGAGRQFFVSLDWRNAGP